MKCEECGAAATVSVLRDPFGKADGYKSLCPKHAPRSYLGTVESFYCPNCHCAKCGNTFATDGGAEHG